MTLIRRNQSLPGHHVRPVIATDRSPADASAAREGPWIAAPIGYLKVLSGPPDEEQIAFPIPNTHARGPCVRYPFPCPDGNS
jgi:hypothetical protein